MEYLEVYIRFNAWYRLATGERQDSRAIKALTRRYVIWKDYLDGSCLQNLRPVHQKLTSTSKDWPALIHTWYRVRCQVVHGEQVDRQEVDLCRLSLGLFMDEIERRQHLITTLSDSQRYIYAQNEWAVDMISVKTLDKLFTKWL